MYSVVFAAAPDDAVLQLSIHCDLRVLPQISKPAHDRQTICPGTNADVSGGPFGASALTQWLTTTPVDGGVCHRLIGPLVPVFFCARITRKLFWRFWSWALYFSTVGWSQSSVVCSLAFSDWYETHRVVIWCFVFVVVRSIRKFYVILLLVIIDDDMDMNFWPVAQSFRCQGVFSSNIFCCDTWDVCCACNKHCSCSISYSDGQKVWQ